MNDDSPEVAWRNRLSTRLGMLLIGVVAILAIATGVLVWRALAALVELRTGSELGAELESR